MDMEQRFFPALRLYVFVDNTKKQFPVGFAVGIGDAILSSIFFLSILTIFIQLLMVKFMLYVLFPPF